METGIFSNLNLVFFFVNVKIELKFLQNILEVLLLIQY